MPWTIPRLRDRRAQVRDDIAAHAPGSDGLVPNAPERVLGDAMASLTHDNDRHLGWVVRMMLPDTAEGEFADRWAGIWLDGGRKPASYASGTITVTGTPGAAVPSNAELEATGIDADGNTVTLRLAVIIGVTLVSSSAEVQVEATTAGAVGNLEAGTPVRFVLVPAGIDGGAEVAGSGLSGGADIEPDDQLVARYVNRIQEPPHGGTRNDWEQWALEVPGVTRAWAAQDMGIGTITVRVMLDEVRAGSGGFPTSGDLAAVAAYIDGKRPVTVADRFIVAPIAHALNLTITDLANDTPEVRANIRIELEEMLRLRAAPGQTIYASWIVEAISAATGEDHHDTAISNVVPPSGGHLVILGTITYT